MSQDTGFFYPAHFRHLTSFVDWYIIPLSSLSYISKCLTPQGFKGDPVNISLTKTISRSNESSFGFSKCRQEPGKLVMAQLTN